MTSDGVWLDFPARNLGGHSAARFWNELNANFGNQKCQKNAKGQKTPQTPNFSCFMAFLLTSFPTIWEICEPKKTYKKEFSVAKQKLPPKFVTNKKNVENVQVFFCIFCPVFPGFCLKLPNFCVFEKNVKKVPNLKK